MDMWVVGEVVNVQRLLPRTQADGQYLLLTLRDRKTDGKMKLVVPDELAIVNAIRDANSAEVPREIKCYLKSSYSSLSELTGGRYLGNVYRLTISRVEVLPESAIAKPLGEATSETALPEAGKGVGSFEIRRRPR